MKINARIKSMHRERVFCQSSNVDYGFPCFVEQFRSLFCPNKFSCFLATADNIFCLQVSLVIHLHYNYLLQFLQSPPRTARLTEVMIKKVKTSSHNQGDLGPSNMASSKTLLVIILLCLALIPQSTLSQPLSAFASNLCEQPVPETLLQSGQSTLTNPRQSNTRAHFFQVPVNYQVPSSGFQVTVSTSRIFNFNQGPGIDYSIRGGPASNSSSNVAQFVLFIDEDFSWSSIRASYMISSRSDFWVGSFLPNTFSLLNGGSNSNLSYTLSNWVSQSPNQGYNFIYLISGLKTSDNSFNVDLSNARFYPQNGQISLQVTSSANPSIELIYISYVIFRTSAPFVFNSYNPLLASSVVYDQRYEGVDNMNGNSLGYEGYGFNSTLTPNNSGNSNSLICVGDRCSSVTQFSCISPNLCTSNNGIIFSNGCFLCGPSQFYQNGQCRARCSGPNEVYSSSTDQCVCINGSYIRINGTCQFLNTTCFRPNEVYSFSTGTCVCRDGYIRSNSGVCVLGCDAAGNEVFNGSQCVCRAGFTRRNNICVPVCATGSFYNSTTNTCQCSQGYVSVNGTCYFQCRTNGFRNSNGACVCLPGYFQNQSGTCVLQSQCPLANQVFNSTTQRCQCASGFLFSQNQCYPICSANIPNAVLINGVCRCIDNFTVVNGRCEPENTTVTCNGQNEVLSNQTNTCVCISGYQRNQLGNCVLITCGLNEVRDINGFCICRSGFFRSTNSGLCVPLTCGSNEIRQNDGQCVCRTGYVRNSAGFCVLNNTNNCGDNEQFNTTTNACQCSVGYRRNGSGVCALICPRRNEQYDVTLQTCICSSGTGLNSTTGYCEVCPANSQSSGLLSGCICNSGYVFNTTTQRCELRTCQANATPTVAGDCICNDGFYEDPASGACLRSPTCPTNSTFNQTILECVCFNNDEYLIDGECQECQANAAWNGQQCVCRSGFFLIGGSCLQCSPNSNYTGSQCVCNFGYFGNGFVCIACDPTCGTCTSQSASSCLTCRDASYSLQNGVCSRGQCSPAQFFNTVTSQCESCQEYCATCTNSTFCNTCISGFDVETITIGPLTVTSCLEVCGDGVKTIQECDDNNTANGDGCNDQCEVESGWTCVGGSTTTRSQCFNALPTGTTILTGGYVALQGEVLQGISMTYLPENLTANGCALCDDILDVRILSSPVFPTITVDYILTSQYRFVARFDFRGLLGQWVFNFTISINQNYANYFTQADMEQLLVVQIDMAVLATFDPVQTLDLNVVNNGALRVEDEQNSNSTTNGTPSNAELQQVTGIPEQALNILFP